LKENAKVTTDINRFELHNITAQTDAIRVTGKKKTGT